MTPDDAARLAEDAFAELNKGKSSLAGRICVLRAYTRFVPCGFALFINTEKYLQTGNRKFAAVGAGPVIVDEVSRRIVMLPAYINDDDAIDRYCRNVLMGTLIGRF